jgi:LysM repeat protein
MSQYPSRMYVSPRTKYLRRVYFAGAAGAIILVAVITLYSLSGRSSSVQTASEESQQSAAAESPQAESPPVAAVPTEQPPQPERFSMPLASPAETNEKEASQESAKVGQMLEQIAAKPAEAQPELPQASPQPAEPTISADAQAQLVIDEATRLLAARPIEVIKAREMLNELLGRPISEQKRNLVKQQLSQLADKWLFSRTVYPQDTLCSIYKVQSGDLLSTIGRNCKVPWEILQQINGLSRPEDLQADQDIKVINGPFHIKIYRSSFTMDVYLQDTFVRSFPVGLGKPGYETPTGLWVVRPGGKLIKPRWTDPDTGKTYEPDDPNYPLGSRWISLDGLEGDAKGRTGFAIHGTKDPHEIGTAKSRGCIRLYNGDVIFVYNLVIPGESKVVVVE